MAVSNINAIINKDIHKVWDIVFAVEKYSEWRSDLSKTEIINEKQFIEYTKDGYATTFSITTIEPYKRWEFDMENSNMSGHWIGVFTRGEVPPCDLRAIRPAGSGRHHRLLMQTSPTVLTVQRGMFPSLPKKSVPFQDKCCFV